MRCVPTQAERGGLSGWCCSASGTFTLPDMAAAACIGVADGATVAPAAVATNAYVFQRVAAVWGLSCHVPVSWSSRLATRFCHR